MTKNFCRCCYNAVSSSTPTVDAWRHNLCLVTSHELTNWLLIATPSMCLPGTTWRFLLISMCEEQLLSGFCRICGHCSFDFVLVGMNVKFGLSFWGNSLECLWYGRAIDNLRNLAAPSPKLCQLEDVLCTPDELLPEIYSFVKFWQTNKFCKIL